ncbi:MAG: hypothetical protein F6J87_23555 [Spirulina sp. SIO3F2]|nr:hypothetical protein [Spirulina sp. SIO3F2]
MMIQQCWSLLGVGRHKKENFCLCNSWRPTSPCGYSSQEEISKLSIPSWEAAAYTQNVNPDLMCNSAS